MNSRNERRFPNPVVSVIFDRSILRDTDKRRLRFTSFHCILLLFVHLQPLLLSINERFEIWGGTHTWSGYHYFRCGILLWE